VSNREAGVAVVVLALLAPLLAFPTVLGAANTGLVSLAAVMTLAGAVVLLRHFGWVASFAGLFALAVVVAWLRTPDQPGALNHFCGIALGLLAMAVVAGWCQTRQRLTIGTAAFLAFGVLALSVGYRSTPAIHKRKVLLSDTSAVPPPVTPLPLSGLHAREVVNPNALSAAAMMVLPVAAAAALAPGVMPALRLLGAASALWAGAIVLMMQSRSAWLSAIVVVWLWMRTWMGPKVWRLATLVLFVVIPGIVFVLWRDHPRSAELVATVAGRMNIWDQALQALRPSPWLGIGLDYFRNGGYALVLAPPNQMVGTPHAHNMFLQTALDLGVVGLAIYVTFIGLVLRRALDLFRSTGGDGWARLVGVGAALALVSVHAYGLLDAVALGTKLGVFQWLSSGLILAAWQVDRRVK
jgi:putative inorganic carbon (HCO3(-)) transporter